MTYDDLINVRFIDAAAHDIVETDDTLGIIMPYHWGPAGEINTFNSQEFYEAYPEAKNAIVTISEDIYDAYFKVKSYFNNGGSKVTVYRPSVSGELFGATTAISSGSYIAFKYPGIPADLPVGTISLSGSTASGTTTVTLKTTVGAVDTIVESFSGQLTNPTATDIDGESTYLPTILANSSRYLQIVTAAPAAIPSSYTPSAGTVDADSVFCKTDALPATQFIQSTTTMLNYGTATFFEVKPSESPVADKFKIWVDGTEKIKVLGTYHSISCEAGVAGAYAKIAKSNNLNQVASARTYGAYVGVITSSKSFSTVVNDMESGIVSVYNSNNGPQIFGVRNSYASQKPSSYFSKANVSRVLSALLRNIKPMCVDAIHTQTASDAVLRAQFEVRLNSVINTFIGNSDLQPDSLAICNESNNSDAQTQGGQILNIILSLHFIGLVERINIKVVATDSTVATSII